MSAPNTAVALTETAPPGVDALEPRPQADRLIKPALLRELIFCATVISLGLLVIFLASDDPWGLLAENFVISPIAVIAAGFANATAIGGGFLFVPLFVFGFGLSATQSLKLSLATQAFGMTSGAIGWSRDCIVRRALILSCLSSFVGVYIGSCWWVIPNSQMKWVFGWVSLLVGVSILLEMRYGTEQKQERMIGDTPLKSGVFALLCFAGGLVTAWASIGIGEVVLLYLLFVYGVRIELAIATGVAALAADSILGLLLHAQLGGIHWEYLMFTAPAVVIGGRYGARLGRWLEEKMASRSAGDDEPAPAWSPLKLTVSVIVILDGLMMLWQVS